MGGERPNAADLQIGAGAAPAAHARGHRAARRQPARAGGSPAGWFPDYPGRVPAGHAARAPGWTRRRLAQRRTAARADDPQGRGAGPREPLAVARGAVEAAVAAPLPRSRRAAARASGIRRRSWRPARSAILRPPIRRSAAPARAATVSVTAPRHLPTVRLAQPTRTHARRRESTAALGDEQRDARERPPLRRRRGGGRGARRAGHQRDQRDRVEVGVVVAARGGVERIVTAIVRVSGGIARGRGARQQVARPRPLVGASPGRSRSGPAGRRTGSRKSAETIAPSVLAR